MTDEAWAKACAAEFAAAGFLHALAVEPGAWFRQMVKSDETDERKVALGEFAKAYGYLRKNRYLMAGAEVRACTARVATDFEKAEKAERVVLFARFDPKEFRFTPRYCNAHDKSWVGANWRIEAEILRTGDSFDLDIPFAGQRRAVRFPYMVMNPYARGGRVMFAESSAMFNGFSLVMTSTVEKYNAVIDAELEENSKSSEKSHSEE